MKIILSEIDAFYIVTPDGKIYSKRQKAYLKPTVINRKNHSYAVILLTINGKRSKYVMHDIIANYFVPHPKDYTDDSYVVAAKDGNLLNYCSDNLFWKRRPNKCRKCGDKINIPASGLCPLCTRKEKAQNVEFNALSLNGKKLYQAYIQGDKISDICTAFSMQQQYFYKMTARPLNADTFNWIAGYAERERNKKSNNPSLACGRCGKQMHNINTYRGHSFCRQCRTALDRIEKYPELDLLRLEKKDREILQLFFEGLSYPDMARCLGISNKTRVRDIVMELLSRASVQEDINSSKK